MFENIMKLFKKTNKKETLNPSSRDTAKERLHLVLMQDRANVSADFLDLMRQEIIEVIKKYIDIDESAMDVRLKNQTNEDGTQGAPALYANIPILNIKDETRAMANESYNLEKNKVQTTENTDITANTANKATEGIENASEEKTAEKNTIEGNRAEENEHNPHKNDIEESDANTNVDADNDKKGKKANKDSTQKETDIAQANIAQKEESDSLEEIIKLEDEKIAEAKKIVEENAIESSEEKEVQANK